MATILTSKSSGDENRREALNMQLCSRYCMYYMLYVGARVITGSLEAVRPALKPLD